MKALPWVVRTYPSIFTFFVSAKSIDFLYIDGFKNNEKTKSRVTNEEMTYTNFGGPPINITLFRCIKMGTYDLKWTAVERWEKYPAVCEMPSKYCSVLAEGWQAWIIQQAH